MWGLIAFVIGLAYGYFKPGRQDKSRLFMQGLLIGLVVGVILALIGYLTGAPALGFVGLVGAIWAALIITLLFILGVWLGDVIQGSRGRTRRTA